MICSGAAGIFSARNMPPLFLTWDPDPALLHLGPVQLRWYSLMFLIGFALSYQAFRHFYRIEKRKEDDLSSLLNYVVFGTIIGARLGHVLFYQPDYYFMHPLEILQIWKGGLASHGGFAGVMVATYLFNRRYGGPGFFFFADRMAVLAPLFAALIRIGNFFNSEIVGVPASVPWAVVFVQVDILPRHPAMLYESLSYLLIFAILASLYMRTSLREIPGRLLGVVLALSFSARFLLEFVKENQVAFERGLPINMGQILCIPFVVLGIWLLFRRQEVRPSLGKSGDP